MAIGAVVAVTALSAFAIFFNGGFFIGPLTLAVAGSWAILAILILTGAGKLESVPRPSLIPLAALTVFWLWSALSFFWSIATDLTWMEVNRTGGYLAVFLIGILVARQPLSRTLAPFLFLIAATEAALYGLGKIIFPVAVTIADPDNQVNLGRLSDPIGYTNGLAILLAMAFPLALYFAAVRQTHWAARCFAAMAAPVLLIAIFFTLSRGAIVALIIGLIFYFIAVPLRIRSFGVLIISVVPAVLVSWWSAGQEGLMNGTADLVSKLDSAHSFRWYLLAAVIAAGLIFLASLLVGRLIQFPILIKRVTGVAIVTLVTLSILIFGWAFASSKPSFNQWATDAYNNFVTSAPEQKETGRLLEISSSDRWSVWQEALSNWKQHALTGTGAQSFPLVHLRLRHENVYVKQTHGLGFGLLTELGIVGFSLGTIFFISCAILAVLALFRARKRQERALLGALSTLMLIYFIHTSFDWDWNLFAITMVFFFITGIVSGSLRPLKQNASRNGN